MSEIIVAKGGKATFTCALPDSSYTGSWSQNGTKVSDDGKRILITHEDSKHTLVITSTLPSDQGEVTFETDKGGVKVPFSLVVTEPPSIDPVAFEQCARNLEELKTGGKMELKVPFGGAKPVTASWMFNGSPVTSGGRFSVITLADFANLTVSEFKAEDCGTYEVTLKNKFGELKVPVEVVLSDTSEVKFETVQTPGEAVKKTTTMTIEETLEAPPKPAGNVKFENMSSNNFTIGLTTSGKGGNGITHYIVESCESGKNDWKEAGSFQEGDKAHVIPGLEVGKRYTFRIRSASKGGVSEPLESRGVTVQPPSNPPEMDAAIVAKLQEEQQFKAGKDLKLKIPYQGHPLPIAQWSKNGKKITGKGRVVTDTNPTETSFGISGVNAEDSGEYTLVLKNKAGSNTLSFKLTVMDVPSAPQGPLEFGMVTGSDATMSWSAPKSDGGQPLDSYLVEKKEMKSSNWDKAGEVAPDQTTFTAEGLTTGSKYTFRVRAVNKEGPGKPLMSAPVVACGPPGAPGVPTPGSVSSNSISINWSAPDNDGGSPITGYRVDYKIVGQDDWIKVPSKDVTNFGATVRGLEEDEEYEFRVTPENSTGKGRSSQTAKPIAAQDAPEPPVIPEGVKATLMQPQNAKAGEGVTLKIPFMARPRPSATWSKEGTELEFPDDDTTKSAKVDKKEATLTLHNVQRGDSGKYKVKLQNSEGEVEAEVALSVKDLPKDPTGPIKVLKASSKAITIGWAEPSDDGGHKISNYLVERKEDSDTADWQRLSKVLPGEPLNAVLDTVNKGTSYVFRVNCSNMLGTSGFIVSEPVLADDKYKPPQAPSTPEITDLNKDGCKLSWKPPSDDGGSMINGYVVEVKKTGRRSWNEATPNQLITQTSGYEVPDLQEGGEYQFRILAHNEAGNGAPSGSTAKVIIRDPIPVPPPVPLAEVVDKSDTSVTLEWKKPDDLDKFSFDGYYVEKSKEGSNKWEKCHDAPMRANRYRVTGVLPGDRYLFRVRGYNEGGYSPGYSTELIEVRQLQEKPKIHVDSSFTRGVQLPASSTLRIVATISGKPTPTIRWLKDDLDIEKRCNITSHDGVSQCVMRNITKEDAGAYIIRASNPSGSVDMPLNIVVNDTPDPPCNISIGEMNEDGSIEIKWAAPVNTGGSPIKHYCLQRRDAYSRSWTTVQDKITGTKYLCKDLKPGVTYYFRVIAENDIGRGEGNQSNLVTVLKKRAPVSIVRPKHKAMDFSKPASFNLPLKPIMLAERGTARFTCAVAGTPEPEIEWSKDDVRIKPNNKFSMRNNYGVTTLTIHNVRQRDAGVYKCVAKNQTGKATTEASLNIKPESIY